MCKYRTFLGADKLKGQEIAIEPAEEGLQAFGFTSKHPLLQLFVAGEWECYSLLLTYFMNWVRSKGFPAWVDSAFMEPLKRVRAS